MKRLITTTLFLLIAAASGQDKVIDTTASQRPPITFPAPDPSCQITVGAAGLSNLIAMVVSPTLSRPIIQDLKISVERNGAGAVTGGRLQIIGNMTPAQLKTVWQGITTKWNLPESATGRSLSRLSLTATNGTATITINLR